MEKPNEKEEDGEKRIKESREETKEGTGIEWKKTNEFKEMKNGNKKNEDKKEEETVRIL